MTLCGFCAPLAPGRAQAPRGVASRPRRPPRLAPRCREAPHAEGRRAPHLRPRLAPVGLLELDGARPGGAQELGRGQPRADEAAHARPPARVHCVGICGAPRRPRHPHALDARWGEPHGFLLAAARRWPEGGGGGRSSPQPSRSGCALTSATSCGRGGRCVVPPPSLLLFSSAGRHTLLISPSRTFPFSQLPECPRFSSLPIRPRCIAGSSLGTARGAALSCAPSTHGWCAAPPVRERRDAAGRPASRAARAAGSASAHASTPSPPGGRQGEIEAAQAPPPGARDAHGAHARPRL